ncbi:MAG: hypothetical protein GXP31_05580 [Kiritimatiellaeota bacterium]|nr:hypothetical protein [Kiritimatiellota bacterium]
MLSPRVTRLRELALSWANEPDPTERGRAIMRAYDRFAREPPAIRLAEAVADYLRTRKLILDPGDLLAGRVRRTLALHPGIHEGYEWVNAAMHPEAWRRIEALAGSPVPREFVEALRAWQKRHPPRTAGLESPVETREAMTTGAFSAWGIEGGHRLPRCQMLLQHGATALRDRAQGRLDSLRGTDEQTRPRRIVYRSLVIAYEAMIDYARRWADWLEDRAAACSDAGRQQELRDLAAVCRWVPAEPARSFWEALQCTWFCILVNDAECVGTATSFGRLDQYLWPYLENDLDAGVITEDQALELIECLFLKCYRTFDFHHTTIGGLTPAGTDGTNPLSWLCLKAMERLRTPRDLAVRLHRDTPPDFFRKALEVAALGLGRPDFWNDEVTVQALVKSGFPLADARDYAAVGCVELTIPGKCNSRTMCHAVNLAKVLEITLHGGRCPRTGKRVGRPHAAEFATYEELHAAYRERAAYCIRLALEQDLRAYRFQARNLPFPFLSACTEGCLDSGRDVTDGGALYNPAGVNLFGIANVADALAAIRSLVFERGLIPLADLRAALESDFDGREDLRQMLLTRSPKFGNDDPAVDGIAAAEAAFYCNEVARVPTLEGGPHLPLIFGTSPQAVFHFGKVTGALPDGRHAAEPLSTSCNPAHGRNLSGLTAELRSVSRLDFSKTSGGVSYIVDIHPCLAAPDRGLEGLDAALRTFFDEGGMEIGINVLSEDQLRAAQCDPENHGHIMVRVFGFSSQFVSLSPALQEYVIGKCRHES